MIISVIGSGGKTTKIKQLKDRYLKEGKGVLMTTSTHMKIEENTLVDPSYEEIINEIKKHGYVHAGSKAKNQKIKALDDDLLKRLKKEIDVDKLLNKKTIYSLISINFHFLITMNDILSRFPKSL